MTGKVRIAAIGINVTKNEIPNSKFQSNQAPNSLGGHSGIFSLHLSHQGNREFSLSMTPKISMDRRTRWCHLSTITGTTPHCLVSTEGNMNFWGTRDLVYIESILRVQSDQSSWLKIRGTRENYNFHDVYQRYNQSLYSHYEISTMFSNKQW